MTGHQDKTYKDRNTLNMFLPEKRQNRPSAFMYRKHLPWKTLTVRLNWNCKGVFKATKRLLQEVNWPSCISKASGLSAYCRLQRLHKASPLYPGRAHRYRRNHCQTWPCYHFIFSENTFCETTKDRGRWTEPEPGERKEREKNGPGFQGIAGCLPDALSAAG